MSHISQKLKQNMQKISKILLAAILTVLVIINPLRMIKQYVQRQHYY